MGRHTTAFKMLFAARIFPAFQYMRNVPKRSCPQRCTWWRPQCLSLDICSCMVRRGAPKSFLYAVFSGVQALTSSCMLASVRESNWGPDHRIASLKPRAEEWAAEPALWLFMHHGNVQSTNTGIFMIKRHAPPVLVWDVIDDLLTCTIASMTNCSLESCSWFGTCMR